MLEQSDIVHVLIFMDEYVDYYRSLVKQKFNLEEMNMIKIGLLGVGSVGDLHKWAIDEHPECELTAICNRTISKAEKMAEGTSIRCYSDYKEMMKQEELDAVIVNLPHDMHHDVTNYILNCGVSVLVEKPMAMNVAECDSMIETAKKNGVVFF